MIIWKPPILVQEEVAPNAKSLTRAAIIATAKYIQALDAGRGKLEGPVYCGAGETLFVMIAPLFLRDNSEIPKSDAQARCIGAMAFATIYRFSATIRFIPEMQYAIY